MKNKKIYVLDTNVLIYDPMSIFKFKDNHVYIPIVAIEELDSNKKGVSDVARSARQATRVLNEIIEKNIKDGNDIKNGLKLNYNIGANQGLKSNHSNGLLFIQATDDHVNVSLPIPNHKADNEILKVAMYIKHRESSAEVILISKDINLRIKSTILGIKAEDYENDIQIEDSAYLYNGYVHFGKDIISDLSASFLKTLEHKTNVYTSQSKKISKYYNNEFLYTSDTDVYRVKNKNQSSMELHTVTDYLINKNQIWGINAKNSEQNFALNLLLDTEIDLVTILGQAGSGKTIITLAACLSLIFDEKKYDELIYTRATIPVGEDIGFLPGTEEEKMTPWAGALFDNLDVLNISPKDSGSWGKNATKDILSSKIKIKSINFMRGRTFVNKILVIDEAQNLTPKQIKTLVTRSGDNTKIICLGNLAQIDAPYLTEINCGITYLIERMKGWNNYGHITLAKVERSRLSDYAASVL